ncbi:hypothetical protein DFO54_102272 [Erwinia sp. AG740]|nr:hypothetical protein DFO54_102272 [Erwinia sp. AG740]
MCSLFVIILVNLSRRRWAVIVQLSAACACGFLPIVTASHQYYTPIKIHHQIIVMVLTL